MRDPDEDKHLKVNLPIRQHIRLHSLKIRTDRTISETVEDAVELYLEMLDDEETEPVEDLLEELQPPTAS